MTSNLVSHVIKPQTPVGAYGQIQVGLTESIPALNYNRNYKVEVYAEYNTDLIGNTAYGIVFQTCNIQIAQPVVPTVSGYCGRTYATLTSSSIFNVFKMPNVLNYKFIFTESTSPFTSTQIIVPQPPANSYGQVSVNLTNPALALQMNKTYNIQVFAEYFDITSGTNQYGNVFATCQVIIGAPAKTNFASENDYSISVYPNPSNGFITLTATQNLTHANVKIYNALGQIILEERNLSGNDLSFDFTKHTSGMYLLEFEQDNVVSRVKLVKE